ncbi:box C/D snoRNA protein 1 [Aricia agestis]|uniref:box C/D snoRNA protein 1 n=1 Tax=Aricia agestis TaxID=91739 RepID=UPI001C2035F4|nr:box C/D snoRNA protein 1 [Aricia agestis]
MTSSESESDNENVAISRLGDCEVCGANPAKYTCPKCEVKTCCLQCVVIHKRELECTGIRDRTKFVRIKEFSNTDLLSDYRLLEECARFVYAVKRDEKKRFTRLDKDLPLHLFKLKTAARKRGTVLQFLAQNFTRHSINTTRYNYKTNVIHWRIEWIFPNVENKPLKFVDEKCLEKNKLSQLLDKYINPDAPPFEGSKNLAYYKSAGFSGIKVLLKAEKVRGSDKKFFELDATETLAENLSGKCIIEFPIIFVVLKDHAFNFDIITPEDEFDYAKKVNKPNSAMQMENSLSGAHNRIETKKIISEQEGHMQVKRPRTLLTEKIAEERRMEIEKEIKSEKKKKPKNLLFTTGYSSEESGLSDSDEDQDNKIKT